MVQKLKNFFSKIKEKIKKQKTNLWFKIGTVLAALILIFSAWFLFLRYEDSSSNLDDADKLLFGIPASQVLSSGSKAFLGEVQIEIFDQKESELKEAGGLSQKFWAIKVKIFNPSFERTEDILVGLEDDRKNRYRPDNSLALKYLQHPDLKSFGTNMLIFPRTFQEGYIFFRDINESSQKYNLIFVSRSNSEKIIYEIQK